MCFLLLVNVHHGTCFYLPGVAPEDFHKVNPFFFISIIIKRINVYVLLLNLHVHGFYKLNSG